MARTLVPDHSDALTSRLLSAAIEVFAERGLDGAGVAAIARRAGVTTGAIYSRWETKQELLLDALDIAMMGQVAELLSIGPDDDAIDVLESLGSGVLVRDDVSDALLLEAIVTARRDPAFGTVLRTRLVDQEGRIADLLERGKRDGLVDRELSTDAIVMLCHAISLGFVVMGAVGGPTAPAQEWDRLIRRLVATARPTPRTVPERSSKESPS